MTVGDDPGALSRLSEEVAHAAGALLLGYYEQGAPSGRLALSASTKSTRTDLVTEADRASERLIVERLHSARPDDAILAEEGGSLEGSSGLTWIVDPLDGTVNFFYGFPAFAVSIACVPSGAPHSEGLAATVHDPLRGETFTAALGRGAALDGRPLALPESAAGRRLPLAEALVATGFSYDAARRRSQAALLETLLPSVRDVRRAGAAALDLCWVAAGRVDAFYEAGLAPWDLAAGALVLRMAGGVVSSVNGLVPDVETLVAGPAHLVDQLVGVLRRAAGVPPATDRGGPALPGDAAG